MTQEEEKQLEKKLKAERINNSFDIELFSNGYGEFPDIYKLTELGIKKIIKLFKSLNENISS